MKKALLTVVILSFLTLSVKTSNGQEPDKTPVVLKESQLEAQIDTVTEFQYFKQESEIKIKTNEVSIAYLKAWLSKINEPDRTVFYIELCGLEQKNIDLKMVLANYTDEGLAYWKSFRRDFNNDINDLVQALIDFNTENEI